MDDLLFAVIGVLVFTATVWIISSWKVAFYKILIFGSLSYGFLIAIIVRSLFSDIMENPAYFPDAYNYISYATEKVSEWQGEGELGYIPLATRGYSYFLATIFAVFGESIYVVILMQLLLASLIPILTFSIAQQLFDLKTAKRSAVLVAFYPDLYVWASFVLKEILALFLICLSLDQFLRLKKHLSVIGLVGTVGPLIFLLFIRPHVTLFMGLVFLVSFLWSLRHRGLKALLWPSIAVAMFAIFMSKAGLPGLMTTLTETPLSVYNRGEILVMGTLPDLLKILLSGEIMPNFVLGIGRYLLSPLPWQADNAYQAVIPGIILWYFVLPLAIIGIFRAFRMRKHLYVLVVIITFLIFWYALIVTGTDPRWRLMILPFMLIFAGYGFAGAVRSMSIMVLWLSSLLVIWLFLAVYLLA